jgi:molecular chaperone DnaK (HSP70)
MAIVGIDLGTTYSVIATPKHFEGKPFFPVRGVTIIKDSAGRRLLPSVVAVNQQGQLIVGIHAKIAAGELPKTVMFAKRSLGTDERYALGQQQMRPEDVSAEILRKLKETAEAQMGEPIDEAVITVPAYFNDLQKQLTKQAGEKAGLRVGDVLQEPVAAALMYCYDDQRDPLTIMTYDLGGGTFDIAILRKEAGVFRILAFDGDRFLGGSDFDKRLAAWIVDRLQAEGWQLDVQPDSPEWCKLLLMAEVAKEKLSENETYSLGSQNTGISDINSEPVTIDELVITRDTFEALIEDDVDRTIGLCKQALTTAGISPGELEEIVMVGGSSRIPVLKQRLQAAFGREPKLVEPDLCVAIGAAIAAQRLGQRIGPLRLAYLPEATSAATIQVTGTVEKSNELPDPTLCSVSLAQVGGAFRQRQPIGEQGGFLFPNVPLAAEADNGFDLTLMDATGSEVRRHRFTVRQTATAGAMRSLAGLDGNVLAKPIAIETVSGLYTVFEAGNPLPDSRMVPARTTDQTGTVRIPVFEGNVKIGAIIVDGISTSLQLGSRVEITLSVERDFRIKGQAYIPAVEAKADTIIDIPHVVVKRKEELRQSYQAMQQRVGEALGQADHGQAFRVGPSIEAKLEQCRKVLYDDRDPTLAKAQELLAEVETLLGKLRSWRPDPPQSQFEEMRMEIESKLLPELYAASLAEKEGSWGGQVKAIVQMAERALQEKRDAEWSEAYKQMERLRNRVAQALERASQAAENEIRKPPPPPDPSTLKLQLLMDLSNLQQQAERRGRLAKLNADFQGCRQALDRIDTKQPDAMAHLVGYYQGQHEPLKAKVMGGSEMTRLPEGPGSDEGRGKVETEESHASHA